MDVTVFRIVVPEPGLKTLVAQKLLSVADHPNQVNVVTYPEFGYRVPEHVFERFEALGDLVPGEPQPPKTFTDGDTDLVALKKRRPRKSTPAKAEEEKE